VDESVSRFLFHREGREEREERQRTEDQEKGQTGALRPILSRAFICPSFPFFALFASFAVNSQPDNT
jgi:hypothetical protein